MLKIIFLYKFIYDKIEKIPNYEHIDEVIIENKKIYKFKIIIININIYSKSEYYFKKKIFFVSLIFIINNINNKKNRCIF